MTVWVEIGGRLRRVDTAELEFRGGNRATTSFVVDGRKMDADAQMVRPGTLSLIVAGRQYSCVLDGGALVIGGKRFAFSVADPRSLAGQRGPAAGAGGPRLVKAPMPGRVVRVLVAAGDAVEQQQGLVVIEAMKMQNELKSPKSGLVTKIAAAAGTAVSASDVLVVVE